MVSLCKCVDLISQFCQKLYLTRSDQCKRVVSQRGLVLCVHTCIWAISLARSNLLTISNSHVTSNEILTLAQRYMYNSLKSLRMQNINFLHVAMLCANHVLYLCTKISQAQHNYHNRVTSESTMSHVQFTTGILLISAKREIVLQYVLL